MSTQVKFGTVKKFYPDNDGEKKGYGFIIPDDGGSDIWFHYDHGEVVVIPSHPSTPEFFGHTISNDHPFFVFDDNLIPIMEGSEIFCLRKPHEGDRVAFYLVMNRNRRRGTPWGYESHWKAAENRIAEQTEEVESILNKLVVHAQQPDGSWQTLQNVRIRVIHL